MNVQEVEIHRILPGKNHRTVRDVDELAGSIDALGVLQPLLVRQEKGADVRIVAGHRRHAAALKLKLETLPCIILPGSVDMEADASRSAAENLARRDPTPLEEAAVIDELVTAGLDLEEIAREVGRSVRHVTRRHALYSLCSDGQDLLQAGLLSVGVAELIAGLASEDDQQAAAHALSGDLEVGVPPATIVRARDWLDANVLRRLDSAPWDLTTDTGNGMVCVACPSRTCRQTELFDELADDDRCLDGACWADKMDIVYDSTREALPDARELSESDRTGLGLHLGERPFVNSGYVLADDSPHGSRRKWRTIIRDLGQDAPHPVLTRSSSGRPVVLYSESELLAAARRAGVSLGAGRDETPATAPPTDGGDSRAKRREARRRHKAAFEELLDSIRDHGLELKSWGALVAAAAEQLRTGPRRPPKRTEHLDRTLNEDHDPVPFEAQAMLVDLILWPLIGRQLGPDLQPDPALEDMLAAQGIDLDDGSKT